MSAKRISQLLRRFMLVAIVAAGLPLVAAHASGGGGGGAITAASAAEQAGFSGNTLVTMVAIGGAESGWQSIPNGSCCYGVWQIYLYYHPSAVCQDWTNIYDNAKCAMSVYQSQGLNAWQTYSQGTYEKYMGEAQAAVAAAGGGSQAAPPPPTPTPTPTYEAAFEANTTALWTVGFSNNGNSGLGMYSGTNPVLRL